MYVTRPLSLYKRDPSALSLPPPEGPNSGILVIQDEESVPTSCFGLCKSNYISDLPFPQNKNLQIQYSIYNGTAVIVDVDYVLLIPVLNQPLSRNQYYCIAQKGKHKGEAYKNFSEEDKKGCCFPWCAKDLKPESLESHNMNQQFEIKRKSWGGFAATSVASDGLPPYFLRREGWQVYTSTPHEFELNEANGIDENARTRLPDFNFPESELSSAAVVIGKWYCPFMFIKDGSVKDQIDNSRYYVMTLEQKWERIFASENHHKTGNFVDVDVDIETEKVAVGGEEIVRHDWNVSDGVIWFRRKGENGVGLSLGIVERMKWETNRFGWVDGKDKKVKVKRVEEFGGNGEWKKFGCYVLVERFVLKRMNGSLVLTYDFWHTKDVRTKWD